MPLRCLILWYYGCKTYLKIEVEGLEKIHEGKFSLVYKKRVQGEWFIVKQLHPRWINHEGMRNRFRKEAAITLPQELIPEMVDYTENEMGCFMTRRYIEGKTWKELDRKLPPAEMLTTFKAIYAKLQTLHGLGYVHGDIKPSNILIKPNGEILLLDMGLACTPNEEEPDLADELGFSMWYAAPELMLKARKYIGPVTDFFSLGVCMYQSFSGKAPYVEAHPAKLLQLMLVYPFQIGEKIPESIFNWISGVCEKPDFKKPLGHYTREELDTILSQNIKKREEFVQTHPFSEILSVEPKKWFRRYL